MEWSCFEDFMPLAGESTVENMRHLEYEIEGLAKGNRYYVRVSAWNMKGYSPFTTAKPSYAVPSSKSVILKVNLCKTKTFLMNLIPGSLFKF